MHIADIESKKLDYAICFGLDGAILNTSKEAFDSEAQRLAGGDGFDVKVKAVGLPPTFQNCQDAVAFGGRVSVIGVGKHKIDLDFVILQRKELNVFGSRNALTADFEAQIDTIIGQGLNIYGIITNVYPFDEAARAFSEFDKSAGSILKILIEF